MTNRGFARARIARSVSLSIIALSAAVAMGSSAARAADPLAGGGPYSWSGMYVGLHAGGA